MSQKSQWKPPPPPPKRNIPPPPSPSPGSIKQTLQVVDQSILHAFPPPPRSTRVRSPPENSFAEAISKAEATLKHHEMRSRRQFDDESVATEQNGDVHDLLEMAKRLENSSVVSAAETEDMQRSLDLELEGITYFNGGVPQEWNESPSQRERETIRNLYGDDVTAISKPREYSDGYSNEVSYSQQQQFSYGKARSYGSSLSPQMHPKQNMTKQSFLRSASDGMGSNLHKVPPPPPPGRKNGYIPPPLLKADSKKRDNSYANMINMAERMSSNKSLAEPSILEGDTDKQYWKNVRGKPKNTTQMKGRGRSSKRSAHDSQEYIGESDVGGDSRCGANRHQRIQYENSRQMNDSYHSMQASLDAYDSCGEQSGAEASQTSRYSRISNASKDRRLIASRRRKLEHEKRKKERIQQQKKKDFNNSIHSLDRHHSKCKSRSSSRSGKRISNSTTKKKSGILALLQGKKDRHSNSGSTFDHNLSIQSMFDSMSVGSVRSRNSRKSARSASSRKTADSRHSKKSTRSTRSFKSDKRSYKSQTLLVPTFARGDERSSGRKSNPNFSAAHSTNSASSSIPILSAAADMFTQQSLPGNLTYDEAMSCSSSISFYDDDSDYDSGDSSVIPRMASVAEAVEHLNSQNKIEKFVSKVKHFL
ncbi:hypothetical protein ACHAXN_009315 [Cyclotella atomus]|jgi:hypothetical protein